MTLFNRKYVEPEKKEERSGEDRFGETIDIVELTDGSSIKKSAYEKHQEAKAVANQQNETRGLVDKIFTKKTTVADIMYDEAKAEDDEITEETGKRVDRKIELKQKKSLTPEYLKMIEDDFKEFQAL